MGNVFESLMLICFGLSWPLNITKAWKARTAKGISLPFYFFIWSGYAFGIASKIVTAVTGHIRIVEVCPFYVLFFYILNIVMVSAGICIFFRNRRIERSAS